MWESIDHLSDFVYRSGHLDVTRRRREWFEQIRIHMVLWWIPAGQTPSLAEAQRRLEHLHAHGPTPHAFTFKARFMPGQEHAVEDEIGCPA